MNWRHRERLGDKWIAISGNKELGEPDTTSKWIARWGDKWIRDIGRARHDYLNRAGHLLRKNWEPSNSKLFGEWTFHEQDFHSKTPPGHNLRKEALMYSRQDWFRERPDWFSEKASLVPISSTKSLMVACSAGRWEVWNRTESFSQNLMGSGTICEKLRHPIEESMSRCWPAHTLPGDNTIIILLSPFSRNCSKSGGRKQNLS